MKIKDTMRLTNEYKSYSKRKNKPSVQKQPELCDSVAGGHVYEIKNHFKIANK